MVSTSPRISLNESENFLTWKRVELVFSPRVDHVGRDGLEIDFKDSNNNYINGLLACKCQNLFVGTH